ncbi:MAG: Smr/MutS family protein [Dissulfurispiraceae bacterium]
MEEELFELPVDGVLDLHSFQPRDVKDLLPHFITICRENGIFQVRIIHGKGSGALRESVHAILRRLPQVVSFSLAGGDAGGWGATIAVLKK